METFTVAAEPYDYEFEADRTALIVIDMQNDFCSPGGLLALRGADVSLTRKPIEPLQKVLAACRKLGVLVIHTREGHRPDLSDCPPSKLHKGAKAGRAVGDEGPMGRLLVRGSESHDFIEELRPAPGEVVVDKPGKGAFFGTDLEIILRNRGITHLLFGGVATHVCVQSTIREATDRGYWNLALEDCCAASVPEFHHYALEMLKYGGGIFGQVSNSEKFVSAVEKDTRVGA